jgi:hypothetical protein
MEFPEQLLEERWFRDTAVVGPSLVGSGEQSPREFLPAKGRSHPDSQVSTSLADVPAHMRAGGRGDDGIARMRCLLKAIDSKAHHAGNHFPTLFHLGVCVLSDAMVGPRPEVIEFEQLAIGVGGGALEHDPFAGHRISDFQTGSVHYCNRRSTDRPWRSESRPASPAGRLKRRSGDTPESPASSAAAGWARARGAKETLPSIRECWVHPGDEHARLEQDLVA